MAGDDTTHRWTREDLIQVEYDLITRSIRHARKQDDGEPHLIASRHLGVAEDDLVELTETVKHLDLEPVQLELRRQLEMVDPDVLTGATPDKPVTWGSVKVGGERIRVPRYVSIPFPAGTAAEVPLYVRAWPRNGDFELYLSVDARKQDEDAAADYLGALIDAATGPNSPYRHAMLEATGDGMLGLRIVDLEPVARGDLVLADEVWDAVTRNVDRMFDRMDRLADAGLGTNRGLVLAGPPGVGKSALCRALAHERVGTTTVMIVSASAGEYFLGAAYERMNALGPSLVLVEDLDLLVGDRHNRARGALVQYLTVLDGLMTRHERVVTIATTNDAELIDEAAVRAARFDQVVHLALPDRAQRLAILESYLRKVDHDADVDGLAGACDGFSGADLREVVRSAVLDAADDVVHHDELLAALVRRREAIVASADADDEPDDDGNGAYA